MNLVEIIGHLTIENIRLRGMCQTLKEENVALEGELVALKKEGEQAVGEVRDGS